MKKFRFIISVIIGLFAPAMIVYAVVQSLNGQGGQTQTFANDANVNITSLNNVHSLGWNGTLPIVRGGTGTSTYATGSIPFINNGRFSGDSTNLFWDSVNRRLGIGTTTPSSSVDIVGALSVSSFFQVGSPDLAPNSQPFLSTIRGGSVEDGPATTTFAGDIIVRNAGGQNGAICFGPDGDMCFRDKAEVGFTFNDGGGGLQIEDTLTSKAHLTFSNIAGLQDFSFPNFTGTFSLLEAPQTFTGLNKFEADTNSTIYVGSSVKSGCIVLGDSDGVGLTYITANDGVLSATSTQPSLCQ